MLSPLRASITRSAMTSRSFSTSRRTADLAKVVLIGRIGSDPVKRETAAGKPYYIYSLATSTGASKPDESGPSTNWHTIFSFNEGSHASLSRVGKGSKVYVEADLEMRSSEPSADGTPLHDRVFLRHRLMNVVSRTRPADEEESPGSE